MPCGAETRVFLYGDIEAKDLYADTGKTVTAKSLLHSLDTLLRIEGQVPSEVKSLRAVSINAQTTDISRYFVTRKKRGAKRNCLRTPIAKEKR